MPIERADYIVVESTYGDRHHAAEPIAAQLERLVTEAVVRGGAIIVPAFAIGRTQKLMFHLAGLEKADRIPRLPTYVDSPMAIHATEIYCAHPEEFEGDMREMIMTQNCPLECADVQLARTPDESRAINAVPGPLLIISASGDALASNCPVPSKAGVRRARRSGPAQALATRIDKELGWAVSVAAYPNRVAIA